MLTCFKYDNRHVNDDDSNDNNNDNNDNFHHFYDDRVSLRFEWMHGSSARTQDALIFKLQRMSVSPDS